MSLSPLLSALRADPAFAQLVEAGTATVDVSGPPGIRPFAIAALAAPAGRCSPSPRPSGRARTSPRRCARCCRPIRSSTSRPGRRLPHERLSPRADTVGRRLAVLRRLAPSRAPTTRRPARSAVVVAPVRSLLQPQAAGLGDLVPVELQAGDEADFDEVVAALAGDRLHPGRHGRAARRVRRTRRHPRRLPADRGPPGAGRVLGRHGRGDPLLRGRRPALARGRDARAVGAAVPRAAADRRRARASPRALPTSIPSSPRCSTSSPTAFRSRAWRRSRRCCVDRARAAARRAARPARTSSSATRSGSAAARERSGAAPARSSSTASWAAAAGGGKAPVDLGAAAYRTIADVRGHAARARVCRGGRSRPFVDRRRPRRRRGRRRRPRRPSPIAATSSARSTTSGAGCSDGWRVVVVTEGHGPAQRLVEVLRERGPRRAARRVARRRARARRSSTSRPAALDTGFVADC